MQIRKETPCAFNLQGAPAVEIRSVYISGQGGEDPLKNKLNKDFKVQLARKTIRMNEGKKLG